MAAAVVKGAAVGAVKADAKSDRYLEKGLSVKYQADALMLYAINQDGDALKAEKVRLWREFSQAKDVLVGRAIGRAKYSADLGRFRTSTI